jgi:hypothetical protein
MSILVPVPNGLRDGSLWNRREIGQLWARQLDEENILACTSPFGVPCRGMCCASKGGAVYSKKHCPPATQDRLGLVVTSHFSGKVVLLCEEPLWKAFPGTASALVTRKRVNSRRNPEDVPNVVEG